MPDEFHGIVVWCQFTIQLNWPTQWPAQDRSLSAVSQRDPFTDHGHMAGIVISSMNYALFTARQRICAGCIENQGWSESKESDFLSENKSKVWNGNFLYRTFSSLQGNWIWNYSLLWNEKLDISLINNIVIRLWYGNI